MNPQFLPDSLPASTVAIVQTTNGVQGAMIDSIAYAGIAPRGYRFTGVWRAGNTPTPVQVFLLHEHIAKLEENLRSVQWELNPADDATLESLRLQMQGVSELLAKKPVQLTWGFKPYTISQLRLDSLAFGQYAGELELNFVGQAWGLVGTAFDAENPPRYAVRKTLLYKLDSLQAMIINPESLASDIAVGLANGTWAIVLPDSQSAASLNQNHDWFNPPFNGAVDDELSVVAWYWQGHKVIDVAQSIDGMIDLVFSTDSDLFAKAVAGDEMLYNSKELSVAAWHNSPAYRKLAAKVFRDSQAANALHAKIMEDINAQVEAFKAQLLEPYAADIANHEALTLEMQGIEADMKAAWLYLWHKEGSNPEAKTTDDAVLQVRVIEGIKVVSEALAVEALKVAKPSLLKTVIDTTALKKDVTKGSLALPTGVIRADTETVAWYTEQLLEKY